MRIPLAALCTFLLPSLIFCQDHAVAPNEEFNFPGTVALRLLTDSMTDKSSCIASIASDLVGVDITGTKAALLQTPSDIDYDQPAFLRIDDEPPIALNVQRQKHRLLLRGSGTRAIFIPLQRTPEFVNALYTRRRIRLRYALFPGPGKFDQEIKFGDFAAAYDRGVQLCHWPAMRAAAVHPSEAELADLILSPAPQPPEQQSDPLDFYLDAVSRRLTVYWLTLRAEGGLDGTAKLAFRVEKDGSVASVPTGYTPLDRACASAVRSANPLAPLPSEREGALTLRVECAGDTVKVSRLD